MPPTSENAFRHAGTDRNKLRQLLLKKRSANLTANQAINQHLATLLDQLNPQCVGLYWPIRGEADIRPCVIDWVNAQADSRHMALPCAQQKTAPLRFFIWQTNTNMTKDIYGIPTPQDTEEVIPDLLLLPCLGFTYITDRDPGTSGRYYRLGYGAGSYDRTLAAHPFVCVGIAYQNTYTDDFLPEPHDQPLTYLITEKACYSSD